MCHVQHIIQFTMRKFANERSLIRRHQYIFYSNNYTILIDFLNEKKTSILKPNYVYIWANYLQVQCELVAADSQHVLGQLAK